MIKYYVVIGVMPDDTMLEYVSLNLKPNEVIITHDDYFVDWTYDLSTTKERYRYISGNSIADGSTLMIYYIHKFTNQKDVVNPIVGNDVESFLETVEVVLPDGSILGLNEFCSRIKRGDYREKGYDLLPASLFEVTRVES